MGALLPGSLRACLPCIFQLLLVPGTPELLAAASLFLLCCLKPQQSSRRQLFFSQHSFESNAGFSLDHVLHDSSTCPSRLGTVKFLFLFHSDSRSLAICRRLSHVDFHTLPTVPHFGAGHTTSISRRREATKGRSGK